MVEYEITSKNHRFTDYIFEVLSENQRFGIRIIAD